RFASAALLVGLVALPGGPCAAEGDADADADGDAHPDIVHDGADADADGNSDGYAGADVHDCSPLAVATSRRCARFPNGEEAQPGKLRLWGNTGLGSGAGWRRPFWPAAGKPAAPRGRTQRGRGSEGQDGV